MPSGTYVDFLSAEDNKDTMTTYRKKLIEVALPLDAINKASAREKSIRHGHPSTLHLWWARRPLAACRAVLFSSLVNDPETQAKAFIEVCGLKFDKKYVNPEKVERSIATASAWQARQPISTKSVGKWKKYEDELQPLRASLGAT